LPIAIGIAIATGVGRGAAAGPPIFSKKKT
jgi:hypothetical protein